MANVYDRIAALEKKLKEEITLKQKIESKKRTTESKKIRKVNTRRKILVGACILAKVERKEWPENQLRDMLDAELTRADDRALFDLPALPLTAPLVNHPEDFSNAQS